MATFKLGAIVTNVAGSIGGTTLRRARNNFVMYNKARGSSRARLLANPRLGELARFFRTFANAYADNPSGWDALAATIQVPDKFGDLKYLTGRQFYIKCNTQLMVGGTQLYSPDEFTTDVGVFTLSTFIASLSPPDCMIGGSTTIEGDYIYVAFECSLTPLRAPTFTTRKQYFCGDSSSPLDISVGAQMVAEFPFINNNYFIRAYVTPVNHAGWKGVTQVIEGVWDV